jgi:phospholipase C
MGNVDRRTFLTMLGAPVVAAAVPPDLSAALAIPAHNRSRSIRDVEHVVFLMQENRSFDHYFGTLRGVRGFADPHPAMLPSGRSVWHQPNGATDLLPFRPDVRDLGRTAADPRPGTVDRADDERDLPRFRGPSRRAVRPRHPRPMIICRRGPAAAGSTRNCSTTPR